MRQKIDRPSSAVASGGFRFTIPSDFLYCRDVQDKIMAEVDRLGYCDSARFAVALGLEEAMVNAIKHGNRFHSGKKVHIEAQITAQSAKISVEDEGPGFSRCSVPDPRAEENLEKCCGRGILLIESYMTRVQWSDGGRKITMIRENRDHAGSGGVA